MATPDSKRQAVKGFIKVFSCAHSMLMTSAEYHQTPVDADLLKAVTGFGAGVGTMGDVCGMVNGAIIALGKKLAPIYSDPKEEWKLALLCQVFYERTRASVGTCSCGEVHGGKHLARNFRKAILTGKTIKCMEMLYKGSGILDELMGTDRDTTGSLFRDPTKADRVRETYQYFQEHGFHCCRSTLQKIQELSGLDLGGLETAASGFIGGIGFSGTLCGAVTGGVLAIGLKYGVDPSASQYKDTLKIIYQGLLKSDKIWSDEKVFRPAKAFDYTQQIYKAVEQEYGSCDCAVISGLDLEKPASVQSFKDSTRIQTCQALSGAIASQVVHWLAR